MNQVIQPLLFLTFDTSWHEGIIINYCTLYTYSFSLLMYMNTPTLLISDDNRSRSGSLVEVVRGRVCQLDSANEYLTLLNPSGLLLHSSPLLSSSLVCSP